MISFQKSNLANAIKENTSSEYISNHTFENCTSFKKKFAILLLKGFSMLNEIPMPSLLQINRRNIHLMKHQSKKEIAYSY